MTSPPIGRLWRALVLCALAPLAAQAADSPFPLPAGLEPDVRFWIDIFSEYSTDEGVLHDNRRLEVVYERLPMPATTSRKQRNQRVAKRREHYQRILRKLASGRRSNLDGEEQRVLGLWPADTGNDELAAAAGRIRFQQGLSDRFRDGLRRAGRWRHHVDEVFGRLGVPPGLAALPHVESSYNPDARSHIGASGIWQFTRSTGRRFMQVDHVLDERNDPFAATEAAGRLLAYNYSIVGNWPMAITAYNHGLAGVRRAMRLHGPTAYADILREYDGRTFGFASRNFYVAFLAALQIDQDPERYFPGLVPEAPVEYATLRLPDYVPAAALLTALGIGEDDLRQHNLALQATIWQGSKYLPRDYEIRVPEASLAAPLSELLLRVPAGQRFPRQLPDLYHTIARGDTLSALAREYGTSVGTLVALNNLGSSHRIRAGQRLRLPAAGLAAPVTVAAAESPAAPVELPAEAIADAPATGIAEDEVVSAGALADDVQVAEEAEPAQTTLLSDPSDYSVAGDLTIEVHPLETLGHYADWLQIRTQRLRDINGFAFRTPVEVGQRIRLDLGRVDAQTFEGLRTAWHRQQQDAFFRDHRIAGITEHVVDSGESVWILALRTYEVPIWLFRQYNPELDLHKVRPGTRLSFPVLVDNQVAS